MVKSILIHKLNILCGYLHKQLFISYNKNNHMWITVNKLVINAQKKHANVIYKSFPPIHSPNS